MPFTTKEFPGQVFKTVKEYEDAKRLRKQVESSIAQRAGEITQVKATILPAPRELLEKKVVELEQQISKLTAELARLSKPEQREANEEGLSIGAILQGESRGKKYTLEVLDSGYLCSNGQIYQSLSGAALGVSGNRRSGWKFWRNIEGRPIGELTGRFENEQQRKPFSARPMSTMRF